MPAVKLADTSGRNDVRIAGAMDPAGRLWFAWSADGRTWSHNVPFTTEVSYTRMQPPSRRRTGSPRGVPRAAARSDAACIRTSPPMWPPFAAIAIAPEARRIASCAAICIAIPTSPRDGIGDGSLLDFYRYAFTAGQYDYMIVTDHQYGGTEYNWWRTEKSEDALHGGRPLLAAVRHRAQHQLSERPSQHVLRRARQSRTAHPAGRADRASSIPARSSILTCASARA